MSRYKVLSDLEKYEGFLYSNGEVVHPISEHDDFNEAIDSVLAEMKDALNMVYQVVIELIGAYDDYTGKIGYHEVFLGSAKTYDEVMSKLPMWIDELKSGENDHDIWGNEGRLKVTVEDDGEDESISFVRYIYDTQTKEVIDECDVYNEYLDRIMPQIELPPEASNYAS
jgi:hypothetical protein